MTEATRYLGGPHNGLWEELAGPPAWRTPLKITYEVDGEGKMWEHTYVALGKIGNQWIYMWDHAIHRASKCGNKECDCADLEDERYG